MKKNAFLSILLVLVSLMLFACGGGEDSKPKTDFKVETNFLEVEVGHTSFLSIQNYKADEISFKVENEEVATFVVNEDALFVEVNGESIGSTTLNIIFQEEVIETVEINVIEEVIYLPVPTGMILLKGVDKEASVKVILTKAGLENEEVKWSLDTDGVVEVDTQGLIAHFHSLARGKVEVTVSVGAYTNSFTIYVTNIRGDID